MHRRIAVLTVVAALGTSLAGPAAADAANRCRAQAERGKVLAQSTTALVYSTGSKDDFNLVVRACTFKDRKIFSLPNQDGGDTSKLETFRLSGRYVAYVVVQQEAAATTYPSTVHVVDLKTRKRVVSEFSGIDPDSDVSTSVSSLVLNAKGGAGWITRQILGTDEFSVHTAAPGKAVTMLDRGTDVQPRSIGLSADGTRLYWTRADQVKSAAVAKG